MCTLLAHGRGDGRAHADDDGQTAGDLQQPTAPDGPGRGPALGALLVLPALLGLGELADAISTAASSVAVSAERIPGQPQLAKPPLSAPSDRDSARLVESAGEPQVVIDIDLRFRDLKAAVPIFTNELSYTNSALVRPIVAFMKCVARCLMCVRGC